jgi:hypothetical protein
MQATSFSCPHCNAPLRIKDQTLLGQWIDCPDCSEPFEIALNTAGDLHIRTIDADELAESNGNHVRTGDDLVTPTSPIAETTTPSSPIAVRLRNAMATVDPRMVGWAVASVALIIVLSVAWPFGSNGSSSNEDGKASGDVVKNPPKKLATPIPAKPQQKLVVEPATTRDEITQQRLKALGQLLTQYLREEGQFPTGVVHEDGLPPERSFSWMSQFSPANDPAAVNPPQWDRGWRDPLNDDFIRRKIDAYRNPSILTDAGDDGYPAAHFVGMAGIGQDAPTLPVHHSRAGVFGYERKTKTADIKDGAANTILVAGVAKNLGSWSSGGAATVRPFTQEPYINGPDGFGTGQPHGMYVLMADGSVRFLIKQTDPKVIRRMAAMADGLDLELKTPGEPGDRPVTQPPPDKPLAKVDPPQPKDKTAKKSKPAEKTPPKPLAPPPKTFDVAAALKQPILQFAQTRPQPLRLLIVQFEEMSGVPISYDEAELKAAGVSLEQPISVTLKNTTVGDILKAVLERGEVGYDVLPTGIRIRAVTTNTVKAKKNKTP